MEQNGNPGEKPPVIKTFKMAIDIKELKEQIKLFNVLAMFMDSHVFEGVINLLKEVQKQYEAA